MSLAHRLRALPRLARTPLWPSAALLLALTGCHSGAEGLSGGTTTGTTTGDPYTNEPSLGPCSAAATSHCLDDQQACTLTASGPSCRDCATGTYASDAGTCEAISGTPEAHDFPDQTIAAGGESTGNCRSWTLNNDAELWVNTVELTQGESSHHSNFVYVPDTAYTGDDGIWACASRGYDFYSGATLGGVLFAQSTQTVHQIQKFPSGAATRIPPHARIVSDIHLLDATPVAVTGHAHLILYTVPASEVKTALTVFHQEYDAINVPPHSSARFTAECDVASTVAGATGTAFAPKIYYVLPHTHTHATAFAFQLLGGPSDGTALLDIGSYNGESHGRAFDPPIDATGAQGFSLTCQYQNSSADTIYWGTGANEMCEAFGWSDTPVFFQSAVGSQAPGTSTDGVPGYKGPCATNIVRK